MIRDQCYWVLERLLLYTQQEMVWNSKYDQSRSSITKLANNKGLYFRVFNNWTNEEAMRNRNKYIMYFNWIVEIGEWLCQMKEKISFMLLYRKFEMICRVCKQQVSPSKQQPRFLYPNLAGHLVGENLYGL